jgi:RND family efflux transporter MFP subunit
MRAKVLLPIASVIIVAGAILWAYPRWVRPSPLILSGTIEARDVQVGSLVGGRIMAVHVDEGASVVAGQRLVTFEPDLLDIQIQEQRAQIDQARARLALQLAGPRAEEKARVRVDWQNAEAERQRLEALLKKGVVAQEEYDRADATARMKLEVLQENEHGNRREDIDAARATLAQQESHLAYLLRQRKETVVTAPADGVIQSFSLRPGDLVAANQAVLNLLETNQLWVRVYVPETQMGLVRVGQDVSLAVDTFPRRGFPGKIVEIREKGEYTPRNIQTLDQRTDLVFGVKVAITPTPELKPGMSALVTLKP